MISPDLAALPSCAKPLMWSAWRWVATTAVSWPSQSSRCARDLGMCSRPAVLRGVPLPGSSVVPKSIRTCRLSLAE